MSSHPRTALLSPEEYLEAERRAEIRSEYLAGEVYLMAGASREHNQIVTNLVRVLASRFVDGPCDVYSSDMRVGVSPAGSYLYPDVVVACGTPQMEDEHRDTLTNPTVIVEVLSPSTEGYDQGRKWEQYRRLASLQDYVLVAQDRPRIDRYVRQGTEGLWLFSETRDPWATLSLDSIGCTLEMRDIYHRVFGTG